MILRQLDIGDRKDITVNGEEFPFFLDIKKFRPFSEAEVIRIISEYKQLCYRCLEVSYDIHGNHIPVVADVAKVQNKQLVLHPVNDMLKNIEISLSLLALTKEEYRGFLKMKYKRFIEARNKEQERVKKAKLKLEYDRYQEAKKIVEEFESKHNIQKENKQ